MYYWRDDCLKISNGLLGFTTVTTNICTNLAEPPIINKYFLSYHKTLHMLILSHWWYSAIYQLEYGIIHCGLSFCCISEKLLHNICSDLCRSVNLVTRLRCCPSMLNYEQHLSRPAQVLVAIVDRLMITFNLMAEMTMKVIGDVNIFHFKIGFEDFFSLNLVKRLETLIWNIIYFEDNKLVIIANIFFWRLCEIDDTANNIFCRKFHEILKHTELYHMNKSSRESANCKMWVDLIIWLRLGFFLLIQVEFSSEISYYEAEKWRVRRLTFREYFSQALSFKVSSCDLFSHSWMSVYNAPSVNRHILCILHLRVQSANWNILIHHSTTSCGEFIHNLVLLIRLLLYFHDTVM